MPAARLLLAALLAFPATTLGQSLPFAVSLDAFHGLNDDHIRGAGLNVRLPGRELVPGRPLVFRPEIQVQYWRAREQGGRHRYTWIAGAVAVLRYTPDVCGRCFIDFGLGAHGIENRRALSRRPTGGNFTFSEQVGIGVYLDEERRSELRVGYAHFSNGGLNKPNPGYDFVQANVRIAF